MSSRRLAIGILAFVVLSLSVASINSTSKAAPAVDPVNSTVVASPTTLPANGTALTKITVNAVGLNGKPVTIHSASVVPNPSTGLVSVAVFSSNPPPPPGSQAVFYFGSTVPQQVTFTVVINGVTLQQQPVVTFISSTALLQ